MNVENEKRHMRSLFERYLSLWVTLCILFGILLGKFVLQLAIQLDRFSPYVGGTPVISLPIAVCLFFMIYPIMVKIDFTAALRVRKNSLPVLLTLILNWAIKPFSMYALAFLFWGGLLRTFIGSEAVDLVKIPLGLDLGVSQEYGSGVIVLQEGVKMLQIPLWRSYLAGAILLGIAPCTAMIIVWSYLAKRSDGLTLIMIAINPLIMLLLYGTLGGFLLGLGRLAVPWQALLPLVSIYVALPLVLGYFLRLLILKYYGLSWFKEKFLPLLNPLTIVALCTTLVLLFSLRSETILRQPLSIIWLAIPLLLQTPFILRWVLLLQKYLSYPMKMQLLWL